LSQKYWQVPLASNFISSIVPNQATSGPLFIYTPIDTATYSYIEINRADYRITSIVPESVYVGTTFKIMGEGFKFPEYPNYWHEVRLDQQHIHAYSISSTCLVCTLPYNATSNNISLRIAPSTHLVYGPWLTVLKESNSLPYVTWNFTETIVPDSTSTWNIAISQDSLILSRIFPNFEWSNTISLCFRHNHNNQLPSFLYYEDIYKHVWGEKDTTLTDQILIRIQEWNTDSIILGTVIGPNIGPLVFFHKFN